MDVTMNGQAVLVEKKWAKTIISSFHAIFSVGMALGAGSGSLFAKFGVGLGPHLLAISAAGLAAVALAALRLVPDPPEAHVRPDESRTPLRAAIWTILPFGIIAFCCMTSEGAMVDWSAIFMSKVIGQNEAVSALAFGTFGAAMTLGRTLGDYLTMKLGPARLMLLDSLLALGGLALALGVGAVWSTFVGFFLVGLGLASIVPIVYSLAGSVRGVSATTGISVVTSIGYTGFFVGPPAIGFLAETFGLRLGLTYVGGLLLVMLALIGRQMQQKGAGGLS
jgi:predicted MFS family arabinose efflux permease